MVHVPVRVADEGASRGRAKGGGGPLVEYYGALAVGELVLTSGPLWQTLS